MPVARLLTLAGFALVLAPAARATTMAELSTGQLADAADEVVRGTVTEVWTELDARGRVWTRAQVEVSEVWKGDPGLEAVVVDQPGGTWAGRTTVVAGTARFSPGEDVVLFLQERGGIVALVGMFQGKYTVRLDPYSREEIVLRWRPPADVPYDHRFVPLPPPDRRLPLAELERAVRARVEVTR